VPGAHCDDLLNIKNNWMENIVASGFFLVTLFLAVEEKVTGLKGFMTKTIKDDGAKRALNLLNQIIVYRGQNNIKLFSPPSELPTYWNMFGSNEQDVFLEK
jgi:hypothetical protein